MKLLQQVTIRQTLGLRLSLDLKRAIGLLELSNLDLAQSLRAAAAENPWLRLRSPRATAAPPEAPVAAEGPSLIAHVLERLPHLVARKADRALALALAEALDPAGFLPADLTPIAARLGVGAADLARVLAALQRIEPRGLFARSLAEYLALQLAEEGGPDPVTARALDALPALAEGGPAALARRAGLTEAEVARALARLRTLDPRPAARFARAPAQTRIADLVFAPGATGWEAQLNPETLPELSLAPLGPPPRGSALAKERQAARGLIGALERRNRALLALGAVIAREQAGFLETGAAAQRVLTRRAAAAAIGMHESSVSRLVASASAATPRGTLPLSAFFCRPTTRPGRAAPESAPPAATARLCALIAAEPPARPLSDAALAAALTAEGIAVTQRGVARLRARAGIPNRAARRPR